MIYKESMKWPDIFVMFNTYRGSYEDTELSNYLDFFEIFFEPMYWNGHIPEELYDCHLIPEDRDSEGNKVTG